MDAPDDPGEALADQLRRIIGRLAVVRPPAEALRRAAEAAAGFAELLEALPQRDRDWEVSEAGMHPGDFVRYSPVSGASNALAAPVRLRIRAEGQPHIVGEAVFGAAYEGPPGHVHGGCIAAAFDELLGFAQQAPGFTATLSVSYRRPVPLHRRVDLDASVTREEGRKRWVHGTLRLDDTLLAEADGLFIAPRSDRDYLDRLGITS